MSKRISPAEDKTLDSIDPHDKWAVQCMMKYGYYIHLVTDSDFENSPSGVNYHTHGCPLSVGHPDFQITVTLPSESVSAIFSNLFSRVRDGEVFESGMLVSDVLEGGYKITFIDATECGRPVLRVILPDPKGNLLPSQMQKKWKAAQYGNQSQ